MPIINVGNNVSVDAKCFAGGIAGLFNVNPYINWSTYKSFTDIKNTYLMTNDFYNSLIKFANLNLSFDKIAKSLKTKNRTLANIKRILLNVVLGIDKNDICDIKNYPKYIKILGVKKTFLPYLKNIKIPYLMSFAPSSYKSFIKNFPDSREVLKNKNSEFELSKSIRNNIFANDLYNYFAKNKLVESTTQTLIYVFYFYIIGFNFLVIHLH